MEWRDDIVEENLAEDTVDIKLESQEEVKPLKKVKKDIPPEDWEGVDTVEEIPEEELNEYGV